MSRPLAALDNGSSPDLRPVAGRGDSGGDDNGFTSPPAAHTLAPDARAPTDADGAPAGDAPTLPSDEAADGAKPPTIRAALAYKLKQIPLVKSAVETVRS